MEVNKIKNSTTYGVFGKREITLNQRFINKHLICSKCNKPMELDDKDTWKGVTTYWFVCPCNKEGTTIKTYTNGIISFPVVITGDEGKVVKTITKDEVLNEQRNRI